MIAARPSTETSDKRVALTLLAAVLSAGAVLRLWLCFHDDGLYYPDEIYQSLEPAHRLVYGYGLIAWEFVEGARNWAFPGFVAGLLKTAGTLGLTEPFEYLHFIRMVFALMGVATAAGCYLLARIYGADRKSAVVGAALFSLSAPLIYFAPKALSETASALPVVLGFALALRPGAARWQRVLGASLLGLAVLFRLHNVIFCVGLLAIFGGRRQGRLMLEAAGVLGVWALLFGLLDRLTWGGWFHSAIVYLRFNLIEGMSARLLGTLPASFYLGALWTSLGACALVIAVLGLAAFPKARGLLFTTVGFLILHSMSGYKQYRFLLPAMPLFCALAGIGMSVLTDRLSQVQSRVVLVLTLAAATFSAAGFRQLTFQQLGQPSATNQPASVYDDAGSINRLFLAAHDMPDLCGLKVEGLDHLFQSGGSSYLHRPVPIYHQPTPRRASGYFNYVITRRRPSGVQDEIAVDGEAALVRIGDTCVKDPAYSWLLD